MPNYTTNGMHLSNEVLQATEDYCGGVAVSFHPHIEKVFHKAIETLSTINTKLNCHVIVGDEKSFVDLQNIYDKYSEILDYIVVLPYQAVGRGKQIETEDVWRRTFEWIDEVNSQQFAFGALFYPYLLNNNVELDIDVYEPEVYSGYRIKEIAEKFNKAGNTISIAISKGSAINDCYLSKTKQEKIKFRHGKQKKFICHSC